MPDFIPVQTQAARIHGWHRSMCIQSHFYRGTPCRPGLVLGLDAGGSCRGLAFGIAPQDWPQARQRLDAREMINGVYRPLTVRMELDAGGAVLGLAYAADRRHVQYWRGPADDAARLILQGRGTTGRSLDYLTNTLDRLKELGIRDRSLERLVATARRIESDSAVALENPQLQG